MSEKRTFQRIKYLGSGWLHHNDTRYSCRLENISGGGALASLKKVSYYPLHPGDKCVLKLRHEDEEVGCMHIDARVVRFEADAIGLEFTGLNNEAQIMLDDLIQKEFNFHEGGKKIIDLGREVAAVKGVGLAMAHFDKGEFIMEREIHMLRLSTGRHAINVHMHRKEIENFNALKDTGKTDEKIFDAVRRLAEMKNHHAVQAWSGAES